MEKLIKKLIVFSIFSAPLGSAFIAIQTPMGNFSLVRILLILALLLDIIHENGKLKVCYSSGNKYSIKYFLCLFLYSLGTIVWSRSLADWVRYNFFIATFIISMVLILKYFQYKEDIFLCLKALNLGILLQAILGTIESFSGVFFFRNIDSSEFYRYKFGGVITPIAMQNNTNNFALMMYVGVFVALILVVCNKKFKLFYLCCSIFYCIPLFLTMSRAALLALLVSAFFSFFILGKRKLLAVLILGFVMILSPGVWDYITQNLVFDFGGNSDLDVGRINLIKNGLVFTIDTLGLGIGAGQIEFWLENRVQFDVGGLRMMHNWWIELLTTYGLIFFVGYLVFYFKLFKYFFVLRKDRLKINQNLSIVVCSFLLGFILACIGPSSILTFEYLWIFWAICISFQGMQKALF